MPPEPLPWGDRKDFFFKRRNQDWSSDSLGSSASRWRHNGSSRWGSPDFRRPPGHGKQGGGWHMFSEESGHGFMQSRSKEKILYDEDFHPSVSRRDGRYGTRDGRYGRNGRINGGLFRQNPWKGRSWEAPVSPNGPGRPADMNGRRSVDDALTYNSHPNSNFVNAWDQLHFKEQHNENHSVGALVTDQRLERESSPGLVCWKLRKCSRSKNFSSRGSGFSHSSSSKSIGVDSNEFKVEAQSRNAMPVQSPVGDAAACVTSGAPFEDMGSRKKPRIAWGEGLAKYEKKKVEGPDDTAAENGMVLYGIDTEPLHSLVSNMTDKSPRVTGFSDSASPDSPSSVACSSSPGLEDNTFVKAANGDNEICDLSGSHCAFSQNHSDGLAFNLENLELTAISILSSSLSELLQSDDLSSVESDFARSTAMNKLLVWKSGILTALEMTESEIDLLYNEHKLLISDSGCTCPCPAASSSLPVVCNEDTCEEVCVAYNGSPRPAPLQLPSGDVIMEKMLGAVEEEHAEVKDEDIDSPGTAISKFVEPLSFGKAVSPSKTVKHGECLGNLDICRSENLEVKCSVYGLCGESTGAVSVYGDGIQLMATSNCTTLSTHLGLHYEREDISCDLILASNKDSANRASDVLNKLLPNSQCRLEIFRAACGPCWKNDLVIKEKLATRKRFSRFKERVITLKFRAFQHLWKEDMRLRRSCAKSPKRFELSLHKVHGSHQKHRSSIRSRVSSPAGNMSLVSTTEIINFTSKLLSDSQVKIYRNTLKMPALLLDKKEKMILRFISNNGLVEDPCAVERERSMINLWMSEERDIFMDKLATFGKDFIKISSFLAHKTTADCIEFYYKNHKLDCFQKIKKKPEFLKQGKSHSTNTYLVTSGKRWNRDRNATSLDMLGAASRIAANVNDGMENQQKCVSRFFLGASTGYKTLRGNDGILKRSNSLDTIGNERETVAVDVLASICKSISSEALSSCITSSVDPSEGCQDWEGQKVGSSLRQPLRPEVSDTVDDEACSDESCGEMDSADWTDEEKSIFIKAVASYGKDFAMISRCVRTRSSNLCKVFFSKARKCLGLDMISSGPGNEGSPVRDEADGGGSDTEDAFIVGTGSSLFYPNPADKLPSFCSSSLSCTNSFSCT